MIRFAWTALSSFSVLPLRLSIAAGLIVSAGGFVYLLRLLYQAFFTNTLVQGWASIVVLQCLFSGMILLALGVVVDYVARTYEQAKGRPLYVVTTAVNGAEPEQEIAGASVLPSPAETRRAESLMLEPRVETPSSRNGFVELQPVATIHNR